MARGDHLKVRRRGYWHHGIDCGDGTVIHYAGLEREKSDAYVRRTSLAEFCKGRTVRVAGRGTYWLMGTHDCWASSHCSQALRSRSYWM